MQTCQSGRKHCHKDHAPISESYEFTRSLMAVTDDAGRGGQSLATWNAISAEIASRTAQALTMTSDSLADQLCLIDLAVPAQDITVQSGEHAAGW
jgi:hypothetical protein